VCVCACVCVCVCVGVCVCVCRGNLKINEERTFLFLVSHLEQQDLTRTLVLGDRWRIESERPQPVSGYSYYLFLGMASSDSPKSFT
jgi:hypothetical protein